MFDPSLVKTAEALAACCREGREAEGLKTLYAPDAVSVEAAPMGGPGSEAVRGLDAIKGKHDWWYGAHEFHSGTVEGPFYHGADRFGLIFDIDVTNKQTKQRLQMKELGLYTVRDGKIVREEFFYGA